MDGVTALHSGLNLLEYMESGTFSLYPFTTSNPPLPANQFENFQKELDRVEQGKLVATTSSESGVQDKLFFRMSASPPDMKVLEESKLFDDIGKFQTFKDLPFYLSKKYQGC